MKKMLLVMLAISVLFSGCAAQINKGEDVAETTVSAGQIDTTEPTIEETVPETTIPEPTETVPATIPQETIPEETVPEETKPTEEKPVVQEQEKKEEKILEETKPTTPKEEKKEHYPTPPAAPVKTAVDTDTVSMKDLRDKIITKTMPEKFSAVEQEVLSLLEQGGADDVILTAYGFDYFSFNEFIDAWEDKYHFSLCYSFFSPTNEAKVNPDSSVKTRDKEVKKIEEKTYVDGRVASAVQSLGIYKGMTVKDAVKKINKYVCDMIVYDDTKQYDTAYDVFITGKGICSSYASLFEEMCLYCGIDVDYIVGYSNRGVCHAWNSIKFSDGTVLYVDTCWNDGGYDYLLVPAATISKTHSW